MVLLTRVYGLQQLIQYSHLHTIQGVTLDKAVIDLVCLDENSFKTFSIFLFTKRLFMMNKIGCSMYDDYYATACYSLIIKLCFSILDPVP